MRKIILVTKDTLRSDDLPAYGNAYWKTPNLDALVAQGTLFQKHYTCAPSTAMAISSMFTGLYAHEFNREKYVEVEPFSGVTLFDQLQTLGFDTHVIWPADFRYYAWKYSKVFSSKTVVHHMAGIPGTNLCDRRSFREDAQIEIKIQAAIQEALNKSKPAFVWLHLPNVIAPRECFGSDIDLFDNVIGLVRKYFSDSEIFVSADHGYLKSEKGISGYGFSVYEGAIRVPLIAPRLGCMTKVEYPTTHAQLMEILLQSKVHPRPFFYVETQYFKQANRKTAIIKGRFKYIFNKLDRSEELYDVEWDPQENVNLLKSTIYNQDRNQRQILSRLCYYPFRDEANSAYQFLKNEKNRIWREGGFLHEGMLKIYWMVKRFVFKLIDELFCGT